MDNRTGVGTERIVAELSRAMAEHDVAQRTLAEASGIAQSHISDILGGKRKRLSLQVLRALESGFSKLGLPVPNLVGEPSDGGPVLGVDEFLASPWGIGVTPEEAAFLRQARWVPKGRKATMQSWYLFLQIVRGLPADSDNDQTTIR